MGSLANLYISQSYQSLIHLGSDITASTTPVELEDGLGNGLGIFVNTLGDVSIDGKLVVSGTFDIEGKITVNDDVRVNGNLSVSGATSLTGSLDVSNGFTASAALIENDLNVGGTLFANKVVTLIESSSIIYSSGSNILGDEASDIQTLIGTTIISGSGVVSDSMTVSNNISSSTISGIGNVTAFSQSVDARLDFLEVPFSTSVDARLDALEDFSSSTFNTFSQSVDARLDVVEATASLYVPFSTSVDSRLDFLEVPFSTSVDSRLDVVEATASLYIPFSTSVDVRLDALESFSSSLSFDFVTQAELGIATGSLINLIDTKLNTSSYNADSASFNTRINALNVNTGSLATTGSNSFVGNQIFSGSVRGNVIPLTITSLTASMNCSLGNFFTLSLASGSATHISASNILPGETITLRVNQPSTVVGTATYSPSIKFPANLGYVATPTLNAVDVITFVTFDSTSILAVATNNLV